MEVSKQLKFPGLLPLNPFEGYVFSHEEWI